MSGWTIISLMFFVYCLMVLSYWLGKREERYHHMESLKWLSDMHSQDLITMSKQQDVIWQQQNHISLLNNLVEALKMRPQPVVSSSGVDQCRTLLWLCPNCHTKGYEWDTECRTCGFQKEIKSH